jgi:hypothetical protein
MKNSRDKYAIDNYSFSNIDNLEGCSEEFVLCPNCKNYGHRHYYLNSQHQSKTEIQCITVITHGHFALKKNTKIPLLDVGRNLWCNIKRTMIPKSECNVRYVLPRENNLPYWLLEKLNE